MDVRTLSGLIFDRNGFRDGFVVVRDGIVVDKGFGPPPGDANGSVGRLIVPGLLDMHTHLGDLGARGDLPYDLGRAVHPGGLKDRYFASVKREDQVAAYRDALAEVSAGTSLVIDYREKGLEGIGIARDAMNGSLGPEVMLLGRPSGSDPVEEIVRLSAGLGIPTLSSADRSQRELVREIGGIYSVHASELYREDPNKVLDLDPDLVVHMVKGAQEDWRELAMRGKPVCVCPRANAAFGIPAPIYEMASSGLRLVLGTDNALAVEQDMWREMELTWLLLRKGGMGGSEAARAVYDMATGRTLVGTSLGEAVLERSPWWDGDWPQIGVRARLSLLAIPKGDWWLKDPFSLLVRFTGKECVIPIRGDRGSLGRGRPG